MLQKIVRSTTRVLGTSISQSQQKEADMKNMNHTISVLEMLVNGGLVVKGPWEGTEKALDNSSSAVKKLRQEFQVNFQRMDPVKYFQCQERKPG